MKHADQIESTQPQSEEFLSEQAPPSSAIRQALAAILSSDTFRMAVGQKEFLRYAVEETLSGRAGLLKEYSIGADVFHRGDGFDPHKDAIVRVEARKLRLRLAKYYAAEGANDPIIIEFRKGSYSPCFKNALPPADEPAADRLVEERSAEEETQSTIQTPPAPKSGVDLSRESDVSRSADYVLIPEEPIGELPAPAAPALLARKWPKLGPKLAGAALILVGLIFAGIWFTGTWFTRREAVPARLAVRPASILVLPFRNLSASPNDEFFSDGLTDELIDSLGRIPSVHTVARASAFQLKHKSVNLQALGAQFGVQTVLEGSVRRSGNRVRISAQLDNTSTGYSVWSKNFDREGKDVIAVQQEIAKAIVTSLGIQLSDATVQRVLAEARPIDSDAYDNYLKARYFWNKSTVADTNAAIAYYEQSVARAPDFAPAFAGLAHCYSALAVLGTQSTDMLIPKIQQAARRALELDSTLGSAHLNLAMPYSYTFDWPSAERELLQGIALNPNDALGHFYYSGWLARVGRLDQALSESRRAAELDATSALAVAQTARILYLMRRYADSTKESRAALARDSNFSLAHKGLGQTYLIMGMVREGLRESRVALESMGENRAILGQIGYGYALSGDVAHAREALAKLLQSDSSARVLPITEIYLGLGDKEEAFKYLTKAIEQRESELFLKTDPVYDPLRSDPRFTQLLARMRLN